MRSIAVLATTITGAALLSAGCAATSPGTDGLTVINKGAGAITVELDDSTATITVQPGDRRLLPLKRCAGETVTVVGGGATQDLTGPACPGETLRVDPDGTAAIDDLFG